MYSVEGIREQLLGYYYHTQALSLNGPRRVATSSAGGYRSSIRGRGIDFAEVRRYQPGDDIRLMDWRVTARTGHAHTKVFHEEKERPVFMVVDQSASMHFGSKVTFKSILAAQVATWLAWVAVHQGDRVGGFVFDGGMHQEFRPKMRRYGLLPMINCLAEYCQPEFTCQQSDNALTQTLLRLRHVARPGSLIFILSDFVTFNEDAKQQLGLLARHAEVKAISIYDQLEAYAPISDRYVISDGEQKSVWDTESKTSREDYAKHFKQRQQSIFDQLQQCHIPMIRLATHEDWQTRINLACRHWHDPIKELAHE